MLEEHLSKLRYNVKSMHQLGIVHRDIKPANIMYCGSKRALVLVDFGLATEVSAVAENLHFTSYCGTSKYMSKAMKDLESEREGFINLFENDMHALELSIEEIKANNQGKT